MELNKIFEITFDKILRTKNSMVWKTKTWYLCKLYRKCYKASNLIGGNFAHNHYTENCSLDND